MVERSSHTSLSMDTPICEAQRHYGQAIPAVDRYIKAETGTWYYCRQCSEQFRSNLKALGFTWSPIGDFPTRQDLERMEEAE